jgi:aminoglycoside 2''-phosphotransferase
MNDIKNKLLKQISINLPAVHWKSAKYIFSGFDNDVVILDNTTVFRFPKNNYSRKILKDEIALLAFLAKKISISLPEYKYIAKNYSCGGYPMIKGNGLTKNKFKALSITEQRKLTTKLGIFLTELHTIPLSSVRNFKPRERQAEKELKTAIKGCQKISVPHIVFKRQRNI